MNESEQMISLAQLRDILENRIPPYSDPKYVVAEVNLIIAQIKRGFEMNGLNGIIIDGKGYEVAEWGKRECNECSLHKACQKRPIDENPYCASFSGRRRKIFRYSQSLTDKINKK